MAKFGGLITKARSAAGKTMGELARALGVSVPYVSDVENSNRAPFTKERILTAAAFLNTDPNPLLAAAATERGAYELEATQVTPKARTVGAALARGWRDLSEDDLDRIYEIVTDSGAKKRA
jgi:transcriptional regulator with XRE-family HTH domain